MKAGRIVSWVAVAVVAVCAALSLWAWNTDLGRFKPWIEARVSESLGRSFTIEGPLSILLGEQVLVSADGLRVSNPDWAVEPLLLSVERLELQIDLRSLLSGPILIEQLSLAGLQASLEVSSTGDNSWETDQPDDADASSDDSSPRLLITRIRLDHAEARYRAAPDIEPALLEIRHFEQLRQDDGMLALNITGLLNGQALEYTGTLGPFGNLVNGRDIRFETRGRAGTLVIEGSGVIDDLSEPRQPELDLLVSGASLAEFERFLPGHSLPAEPYRVQVKTSPAGARVAVAVAADSDGLQLELEGNSARLLDFTDIRYRLAANGDSLDKLGGILGYERLPAEPFVINGLLERTGVHLDIEELRLTIGAAYFELDGSVESFPSIHDGAFTLNAKGPEIERFRELFGLDGSSKGAFSASLALRPVPAGESSFDASLETSVVSARARGKLGVGPTYVGTVVELTGSGPSAINMLAPYGIGESVPAGAFSVDARLSLLDEGLELAPGSRLELGGNQVIVSGLIGLEESGLGTDFGFDTSGDNLRTLLPASTSPELRASFPDEPFRLQGSLAITSAGYQLRALQGKVGTTSLSASGLMPYKREGDSPIMEFKATVEQPDVRGLLAGAGRLQLRANPLSAAVEGRLEQGIWQLGESKIELGSTSVVLQGTLGHPPDLSATQLVFSVNVPRLDDVFELSTHPHLIDVPLLISAELGGSADSLTLSSLDARVGESDLAGQGSLTLTDSVPYLQLSTHSRLLDLRALAASEESAETEPLADDRVIPDLVFPMHQLTLLNADFDITVDELRNLVSTQSNAKLVGFIRDGGLIIEHFEAQGLDGALQGTGSLTPGAGGLPKLDVAVQAGGLVLDLRRDRQTSNPDLPVLDVELALQGQGADLRSVAASANGHLHATAGAGTIPNSVISRLDAGLIKQLIDVIIPPKAQSSDSQLKCLAARLEVNEGMVRTRPGAMLVTDKIQMVSKGTINLATEELSLTFDTYPTKLYKANVSEVLINPFVKISGTLAKPELAFDAGQVGLAAATAGLSILAKSLIARLSAASDPCAKFLEEGE